MPMFIMCASKFREHMQELSCNAVTTASVSLYTNRERDRRT